MREDALLTVQGIAHSFGAVRVLSDVSLQVLPASLVGLIGPNGSGKTTLFNLISGYLQPLAGAVSFGGRSMAGLTVQARSRAGLVRTFQTPKVFESMSVLENIMLGCTKDASAGFMADLCGLPSARQATGRVAARAREVCERFGLDSVRDAPTQTLPAGQRRVLELARAVAGKPRLVLLDEPTSGLNDAEIRSLERWIAALVDEGIAVLLVSHDMALMSSLRQVHMLFNGEILASGPMSQLQNDARVREVYLGDGTHST